MTRILIRGAVAIVAAFALTGCFAYVTPSFIHGATITPPGHIPDSPTVHVEVSCEWEGMSAGVPSDAPSAKHVGVEEYLILIPLPVYWGGTAYMASPDYAADQYRELLFQEMHAAGLQPQADPEGAVYHLSVKLVHARYHFWFVLDVFIPIWQTEPEGVVLAAELTVDTPTKTYQRRLMVAEDDSSVEVPEAFARVWRLHASQTTRALADLHRTEGQRR